MEENSRLHALAQKVEKEVFSFALTNIATKSG